MFRFFAFSLLLLGGVCLTLLLGPLQEASAQTTPIRVRGNEDFPPYEFLGPQGRPAGYSVQLTEAVARVMELELELSLGPWQEVREQLEAGRIDMLTGILYSVERDQVMDFSIPHLVISYSIFVRKNSPIRKIEDVYGKEIIVVKDVYAHDWLKRNNITPHIFPVERPQDALRSLSEGRHDMAVLVRLHGLELMRRLKLDNLQTVGPPVLSQKFCFAVKAGNSDLLAKLNEGLFRLQKSGEYDRIYLKWFSVYEQKRLMDKLLRFVKLFVLPLILVLVIAFLWIRSLDRTVRRKTKELIDSEAMLSQIIEELPFPTLVGDAENRIVHWNRTVERLTGIPADEIIGASIPITGGSEPRPSILLEVLRKTRSREKGFHVTVKKEVGAGTGDQHALVEMFVPVLGEAGKWLLGASSPFRDVDGRIRGTIEIWQDLTDRKALEQQLVQAQKMEALGTLARGVAHDFAGFLQAILSYTEAMMRTPAADDRLKHQVRGIRDTVVRAKELIQQILTFGRQDRVELKPVNASACVEKTLDIIAATAPKNIEIRRTVDADAFIMADASRINQVILNLCTNGIQAMDSGGALTVELHEVLLEGPSFEFSPDLVPGRYLQLIVSDTGPGIREADLERIFEPFFTTKKKQGGSGMGLAIVHGIVKGFGGSISVSSRVGSGTVFKVLWPMPEGEDRVFRGAG